MPEELNLSPDERAVLEEMRDRPVPRHPLEKHPYEIDGFRAQIGKKAEVKAERQRIARARDAWASLDPVTLNWLRWMTAERVIELLAQSSNTAVADAARASSEDELAQLRAELAEGCRFENTSGDGFELAEDCPNVPGEGPGPLDPPAMLEEAENALRLPPDAPEKIPNLRAVVEALYLIWRRGQLVDTPRTGNDAIAAIAPEVSDLFDLPTEMAEREVRAQLSELAKKGRLPKFV